MRTQHLGGDTLCAVADRYTAVKIALKKLGKVPTQIADATAPRFIDRSTWEKVAADKKYSPWFIYDPAPETWAKWELGRSIIDGRAASNRRAGKPAMISLGWILDLHRREMKGLISQPGVFRTEGAAGAAVDHTKSIALSDIENLVASPYRKPDQTPLVDWTISACYEDVPYAVRAAHPKPTLNEQVAEVAPVTPKIFTDAEGVDRECGYFNYPKPAWIADELAQWEKNINDRTARLARGEPIDVLLTASRAQKWFISIHPFPDGNGRTSRFIMDYLLESLGLPPPLLANFDRDLLSTEADWADEIGRGMLHTLDVLEGCVREPLRGGCATISKMPE